MRHFKVAILIVVWTAVAAPLLGAEPGQVPTNSESGPAVMFASRPANLWQGEVGEGFRSSVQTLSLTAGATAGFQAFGGQQDHDLALASLSYGHMLGQVVGDDHWYRGNWELRGEFFGGSQFSPSSYWLVGLTPHLRFNLATGTRWVPFVDGGAGVTATGIGPPDLSGIFEFNLQVNTGVNWFVRNNLALTIEAGYMHISCAGIHDPNQGLNCAKGMVGLTCFF
ncbi:MAG: acyloxyacyl hydrolase [Verrucomicrobiia bacterium]